MSGLSGDPVSELKSMFDSGEYEQMYDYCRRMLDDSPGDYTALHNIYIALNRLERYDEAIPYCDMILERYDRHDEHAFGNKILALLALRRNEDVERACTQKMRNDPLNVTALTGMGLVMARAGNHEDALAYYDRALSVSPDDLTVVVNRGHALAHMGRYDEALLAYDAAEPLAGPLDRHVSAIRSKLFSMLGREDEAFLAAQGVRDRDMEKIMSDARRNDCSVFHQFCNNEYSELLVRDGGNNAGEQ